MKLNSPNIQPENPSQVATQVCVPSCTLWCCTRTSRNIPV